MKGKVMKNSKDSQERVRATEIKTGGGGTQTIETLSLSPEMVEIKTGGGGTQIGNDDQDASSSKSVSATA
jgi:hypothetical protein